jgi:hypothetical protein
LEIHANACHRVGDEDQAKFSLQFLSGLTFQVRPRLAKGAALSWYMSWTVRTGTGRYNDNTDKEWILQWLLDGHPVRSKDGTSSHRYSDFAAGSRSDPNSHHNGSLAADDPLLAAMECGNHSATLEAICCNASDRSVVVGWPTTLPIDRFPIRRLIEVPWQLVSEPTVRPLTDPSIGFELEKSLAILGLYGTKEMRADSPLSVCKYSLRSIELKAKPSVPLAFQVIARWTTPDGEKEERELGTYTWNPKDATSTVSFRQACLT